jgi:hypothetical protein
MREKSAAAMPVRLWAARTVRRSPVHRLDDLGSKDRLELRPLALSALAER